MAAIGGEMLEVTCSDSLLGTFRFEPKVNESYNVDPGGYRINDDASQLGAGGNIIIQKNRVRWSVEGMITVDTETGETLNDITTLINSNGIQEWSFSHVSGSIQKGKGVIVGDVVPDFNTATVSLKWSGGGELENL